LIVLAAAVRFIGIGHQSYWYDEAHTVWILHFSIGQMRPHIRLTDTTPPFYFLLAWFWAHLFGYGEAGLRSLSALVGVLTVPVAYAAGTKLFSRRAGLIVAALTACNPMLVWYSQEARSYALLVLLTTVALLAFAHLRTRPTRGWMVTWVIAAALALATHYYAALAIAPEAIWLLAHYRPRRMVRYGVEALVVWSAPLAVLAFRQMNSGVYGWLAKVPILQRAEGVPTSFAIGPGAPGGSYLLLASAIVVAVSAWLIVRRTDSRERRIIRFVAGLAASGFILVVILLLLGFDEVDSRNMLALCVPVALVIAGGLGARRAGSVGAIGAVALCTVGVVAVVGVAVDARFQRPAWRAVAHALGSQPDRAAIFAVDGCQLLPLSLNVSGLHFAPVDGAVVKEIDVIAVANQVWYTTCIQQKRSGPILRQLGSFRATGGPVRINQFSVLRLRSSVPVRVTQQTFTAAGLRGDLMVARRGSSDPAAGYSAP
jgi:hypothetical protein